MARLRNPQGLAFDSDGNLYIAARNNNDVRKVEHGGDGVITGAMNETITTVAGSATGKGTTDDPATLGDGGPATLAMFRQTVGMAFDSAGNLYIADNFNHRIRKVEPGTDRVVNGMSDETITTFAGSGPLGIGNGAYSGDGVPATSARLNLPLGVTLDNSKTNLYIGDRGNHVVRRVNLASGTITRVAGIPGAAGFNNDNQPASLAQLNVPTGVSFDKWGNLYICENGNNRIRKITARVVDGNPQPIDGTETITTFVGGVSLPVGDDGLATSASLFNPQGLSVDSLGNIYIADTNNHRVRKVDEAGIIKTIAGIGISGFSGDDGNANSARINGPQGVTLDSVNIYIADSANNRVRKVNLATGVITTVAGNGVVAYNGDNQPPKAAAIGPHAVAVQTVAGQSRLYISDTANQRVRMVSPGADGVLTITTVAGNGQQGSSGDGDRATLAEINNPQGIAFYSGNLYISTLFSQRIRKVVPGADGIVNRASDEIITTFAGSPNPAGFSGDGGPATAAQLNFPGDIAYDPSGNFYIADKNNHRVRRLNVAATVNVDPDTVTITSQTGKWVTAYIQFPAGRRADNVDLGSVMIKAIAPMDGTVRSSNNQLLETGRDLDGPVSSTDTNADTVPDQLMLKFNRTTVASWATAGTEFVLRVEGRFNDGRYFSGDTPIRTNYPPTSQSPQPADGGGYWN